MIKETGSQSFPTQEWDYDGQNYVLQYQDEGIALRDYFAAKAMNGLTSNPSMIDVIHTSSADWLATTAYKIADAMLEARGE